MGYRNALERIAYIVPLLIVVLLAAIFRSELFYSNIANLLYSEFRATYCELDETDFEEYKKEMAQDSLETGVSCAFLSKKRGIQLDNKIYVYITDEVVKKEIEKKCNIDDKTYISLIYGQTRVIYRSFDELTFDEYKDDGYICLCGTDQSIEKMYRMLSKNYSLSYPVVNQDSEFDMILVIMVSSSIFMVLLNLKRIYREKKEVLIRVIYGEDLRRIVVKECVFDFGLYQLIYFSIKFIISCCGMGEYMPRQALLIYEIASFISSACNLIFLRMDIKGVLSNVIDLNTIRGMYVLKAVVYSLVVFSLITSASGIYDLDINFEQEKYVEEYGDNYFLEIYGKESKIEWSLIYGDEYQKYNPVISTLIDERQNVLFMNENAKRLLPEAWESTFDENIRIYIPQGKTLSEDIYSVLSLYVVNMDNEKIETVEYTDDCEISYLKDSVLSRFASVRNPVVIMCPNTVSYSEKIFGNNKSVCYEIDEYTLEKIKEERACSIDQVKEIYRFQNSFEKRIIRLTVSFCVVIILINIMVTISIISMDYHFEGKGYIVKKIMGYTYWEKNKIQFIKILVPDVCISITEWLILNYLNIGKAGYGLLAMLLVFLLDVIVLMIAVLIIEQESAVKVLKGGSL